MPNVDVRSMHRGDSDLDSLVRSRSARRSSAPGVPDPAPRPRPRVPGEWQWDQYPRNQRSWLQSRRLFARRRFSRSQSRPVVIPNLRCRDRRRRHRADTDRSQAACATIDLNGGCCARRRLSGGRQRSSVDRGASCSQHRHNSWDEEQTFVGVFHRGTFHVSRAEPVRSGPVDAEPGKLRSDFNRTRAVAPRLQAGPPATANRTLQYLPMGRLAEVRASSQMVALLVRPHSQASA